MGASKKSELTQSLASTIPVATLCAGVLIAQQVAGKAMRDALFLEHFAATSLPNVLIASAMLSIVAILYMSRVASRSSPASVSPLLFGVSGILVIAEWAAFDSVPEAVSILVFLHVAVLGSILISTFWSVVNERLDPRSAKQNISKVAAGATVGGLLGGILAERFASRFDAVDMLPIVAILQFGCAVLILRMGFKRNSHGSKSNKAAGADEGQQASESGFRVLSRVGYLQKLALIILLGNFAAILLDYMLKCEVSKSIAAGGPQMRFFAVFYTLVSLATFGIQATFGRRLLAKPDSIARVASIRPGWVVLGGILLLPGFNLVSIGIIRGIEAAIHNSLFRSAYELLYNPIVPEKKRPTKPIIDVGFDRLGDAFGGGVVRLVLLLPAAMVNMVLLGLVLIAAAVVFLVTRTLRAGHTKALEKSLLAQDRRASEDGSQSFLQSLSTFGMGENGATITMGSMIGALDGSTVDSHTAEEPSAVIPDDPIVRKIIELRSGDPQRVNRALEEEDFPNPVLASHILPLLAWDAVSKAASRSLGSMAPEICGLLIDNLLDAEQDFTVRRRIPPILGKCNSPRAVSGLLDACSDRRFEVRYKCGCALARIKVRNEKIVIDRERVFSVVLREVSVDRRVWESQRLLDSSSDDETSELLGRALKTRVNRSMEHVFTLLSLVLSREPLRIAFRALHTSDPLLRGTALEYLESVLPSRIRKELWTFLEGGSLTRPAGKPDKAILEALLKSQPSIELNLDQIDEISGQN